jgi:hypothetical protein
MFTKMGFGSNLSMLTNSIVYIIEETILYFIWTKPWFFELSDVFFFARWKQKNYVPYIPFCLNFIVLLSS